MMPFIRKNLMGNEFNTFDKLNKSNYVLDNGKQLAFMLMYAKANGVNVVAKVETLSVNNPTTILAGNTLIGEDVDFISKDNILSEKYKEAFDSSLLGSCSFYNNSVEVGIGIQLLIEIYYYYIVPMSIIVTFNRLHLILIQRKKYIHCCLISRI